MNIFRLILRYSTPSIISTVVDAAYNLIDRIFVGRACGEEALAAVTVCFSPTLFFLAFAMTVGQGSATMVSIMLGEKKRDAAEAYLGQAAFLFLAFSALLVAVVVPNMEAVLRFFGATEKILPMASQYYTILVCGIVFEKISYGLGNLIRAEGRPSFAMSVILTGGIVNAVLDYVFLFHFGWGVRGAAAATVIAQACASVMVVHFYFFSGRNYLKLRLKNVRVRMDALRNMLAAGSPSFVIQMLAAFSTMLFVMQARNFGAEGAIAIIGVSSSVNVFLYLPVVGLSMGAQPIFGYNWGARNFSRVREAFVNILMLSTGICVVGFAFVEIFAGEIFSLFLGGDSPLMSMGERAMRILACMFPLIGANIVTSGYFQATKRPKFSIFVTTLRQLIFLAPLLFCLPHIAGLDGVWASFPIADFAAFTLTFAFIIRELRSLDGRVRVGG